MEKEIRAMGGYWSNKFQQYSNLKNLNRVVGFGRWWTKWRENTLESFVFEELEEIFHGFLKKFSEFEELEEEDSRRRGFKEYNS